MRPELSTELTRLVSAHENFPETTHRYATLAAQFEQALVASSDCERTVRNMAQRLWEVACVDAQNTSFDDRPLYWGRLLFFEILTKLGFDTLVPLLELESRNFVKNKTANEPTLMVTGFDPFGLNVNLNQCNPSGIFALALHGCEIAGLHIHSMVFPVRYADFDARCVEKVLRPFLTSSTTQLVVTTSMGRDGFDLERFPAKCRGSGQPDNQNVDITERPRPFNPPIKGASFYEFSLPVTHALPSVVQRHSNVRMTDNRQVATLENGQFEASSLRDLEGKQAVAGSGGNFLSNEISYRALRLQSMLDTSIPMGHIHVPRVVGFDHEQLKAHFEVFKDLLATLAAHVRQTPT